VASRSIDGVGADSLTGRPELFGHIHRGHEVQKLSKGNLDTLVGRLRRGEAEGRKKTWTPRSVNYLVYLTTAVLDDQVKQGNVVRNVARLSRAFVEGSPVLSWAVEHLQLGDVDDFDLVEPRSGTVVDPHRHIGTLLHHTNCTLQLVLTHRRVRIVVNATAHTVPAGAISFDALVALAFPTPPGPNPDYTVRYSKGPRDRPTGTVARGHSVDVRNGMVFVVTATDKS
jgi:hypothetical protein